MTVISQSDGALRASQPGRYLRGGLDRKTAVMTCPECGGIIIITEEAIRTTGHLTCRLDCPYTSCTFSDWIMLKHWRHE